MAQAQQQTYPARAFMRPVKVNLGSQAFAVGAPSIVFPLRQLGYLQTLLVHLSGTYTGATATLVFLAFQPYNIISLFTLQTPDSPLLPINAGGASMHVWNLRNSDFAPFRKGFRVPSPGITVPGTAATAGSAYNLDRNTFHDSIVDQVPTGVGAHTLHLWWVLPFSLSVTDLRGLLPLGNSTVTNLQITPTASLADIVTTAADFTVPVFTVSVDQIYLTPPPVGAPIAGGGVDVSWTVAYDETQQQINGTGLQKVTIVPNYTILGIQHQVRINSLPDQADITNLNLRLNSSYIYEPPGLSAIDFEYMQAMQQGQALPDGVFLYDQDAMGELDWIHTEAITEIESDLTIAGGATVVAGDFIRTSLRRLVLTQRAAA